MPSNKKERVIETVVHIPLTHDEYKRFLKYMPISGIKSKWASQLIWERIEQMEKLS